VLTDHPLTTKVLINVPRLDMPGGVSNYYSVLRKYLGPEKVYLEIGAKAEEAGMASAIKRTLSDYWQFHSSLSTGQFDLVHLNPSLVSRSLIREAVFLIIARGHGLPVLVFFRGWDNRLSGFLARRLKRLFRYACNRTAGIIVLAEEHRNQLVKIGVSCPVYVRTTVVDDDAFTTLPNYRKESSRLRILYLSRLDRGKGIVTAIRAFSILKSRCPGAKLVVAGDGPDRKAAESEVRQLDLKDVEFLGHVVGDEKKRAFLSSDLYIFPTFFNEGMPNSVLEAMCFGLPIITRPVGGLKDFFQNGRMGFMTESDEPAHFAELLERLALDPQLRQTIGRFNREYGARTFAASMVARQLEDIYEQVLG
jgi:glycosyltransferase involved in cell wall biosynthesis